MRLCLPLLLLLVCLSGCRPEVITVDAENPDTPQFAYRLDEVALLKLQADNVVAMEMAQDYDGIYDKLASEYLKQKTSHRDFLRTIRCVEEELGPVTGYDMDNYGFVREQKPGRTIDILRREVHRTNESVIEELHFSPEGPDMKLDGIFWSASRKGFIQCIRDLNKPGAMDAVLETDLPAGKKK
ncbi:MAG: hypothetical protein AB7P76_10420 [Candidatus Melainabacteria bacterium]